VKLIIPGVKLVIEERAADDNEFGRDFSPARVTGRGGKQRKTVYTEKISVGSKTNR
jgi:hypothetical protein